MTSIITSFRRRRNGLSIGNEIIAVEKVANANVANFQFTRRSLGEGRLVIGYWQHFHIFTFPTYLKITIWPVGWAI